MTGDRIGCCIPGCRRTFKRGADDDEHSEIICGRHWRTGDTKLREQHKRLRKRLRKIQRLAMRHAIRARGDARLDRVWAMVARACGKAWVAVKEDVTIKAAFGIENAPKRRPRHELDAGS